MKHSDVLFEIGCEELPASVIRPAAEFLSHFIQKRLTEAHLGFAKVSVEGTPRRLVLIIRGLATKQADLSYEVIGPRAEVAFLESGELSKAGLGFLQAKNIKATEIFRKATSKGEVIAAQVVKKGRLTQEILPTILENAISAIPFPKKMRWDDSGVHFIRPVRWLCALFGTEVLQVNFGKVQSSNLSCGHRFLAPKFIPQKNVDAYLKFLADNFVELSFAQRRAKIIDQSSVLARSIGGELLIDESLLDVVANLIEYPWPLLGSFDAKFLKVPKQVLVSEMREHQKVFSILDSEGQLLPAFIVVAGSQPENAAFVASGHARVLRARFEDGAFYFAQDSANKLVNNVTKLEKVMFQHKLGTVRQKTERLENLLDILGKLLGKNSATCTNLRRAALLCKADLVSGVVGEFPELQGVMGRIYAANDGENGEVAQAIEEHYWPKNAADSLPMSEEGAMLALADKLDTVVGIIAVGKAPTASADPFGLRRAAIGLIRIVVDRSYDIPLRDLIGDAVKLIGISAAKSPELVVEEVLNFIQQRVRGLLIESSGDDDVSVIADAVLENDFDNILDTWAKFSALTQLKKNDPETFLQLMATFKRVGNILRKARAGGELVESLEVALLTETAELELAKHINLLPRSNRAAGANLESTIKHYCVVLGGIAQLKPLVDAFFDQVMVMCEDKILREARMTLLAQVENAVLTIADFTKI